MSKSNRSVATGGLAKLSSFTQPWHDAEESALKAPELNPLFPYSVIQFDPSYFGAILSNFRHSFSNPAKLPANGSDNDTIPESPADAPRGR